ncbi:MAG: hypothetical protein FWE12_05975 [Oscillospiraceae bacterium]|nr:hypothetical protein [Oscillospiraceae bacterium]
MKKRIVALLVIVALMVGLLAGCGGGGNDRDRIVVGAKDFTEQMILGYMTTILLEHHTDLDVDFRHGMGTHVLFAALTGGDVDVYIEYTGTVYGSILGYTDTLPAAETYAIAQRELDERYDILMLDPLGFNNTYTLAVRQDTAAQFNLRTISDLIAVSDQLTLGATFEFLNRYDGWLGLRQVYAGIAFRNEVALDGTLRYAAIDNDEIQVTDAFSTDGMLLAFDLVVLEDDLAFFPPYFAAPIIRRDTSERHPELLTILAMLADVLDDDTMRGLNYRVDVLHENPSAVAQDFLQSRGLI